MKRGLFVTVMVGGAVLALSSLARAGAPAGATGVVDMPRIASEYRHMQELNRQFQEFQQEKEEELALAHRTRLLTEEERTEFYDLRQMAAPTEDRTLRLAELEMLGDRRERRLFELQQKTDRTAEENAEFVELSNLYQQRMQELNALQAELQQAVEEEYDTLSQMVADSVEGAIEAVAQERGLTLVFRKEALLFGGDDITDQVLERLNAETPA